MNKSIKNIEKNERIEKRKNRNNKEIIELIKNTLIMIAIALVAGGVLGVVYDVTKEPIAAMAEKEKKMANATVFDNADHFSETKDEYLSAYAFVKEQFSGVDVTDCIIAYDSAETVLGYVMEVTSHEGYGGDIVFRIGIQTNGTVNGISITSISETAGLGMRADEVLTPQFRNKMVEKFTVTKTGASGTDQIDAISSATITSKAVTNAVNASLELFRNITNGGEGNE